MRINDIIQAKGASVLTAGADDTVSHLIELLNEHRIGAVVITDAEAQALITGHCGPKAFRVLRAAGIKVFNTDAPTIAEALSRFRAGELIEAQSANIEGHWA